MDITVRISQGKEAIRESHRIRYEVFYEEQGIPFEIDNDGLDEQSYHALAHVEDEVIGVARLTPTGNQKAILSRVAVRSSYRGYGIASRLVSTLIEEAERQNIHRLEMRPHEYLKDFYERFGFKKVREAGSVAGHNLLEMELFLD